MLILKQLEICFGLDMSFSIALTTLLMLASYVVNAHG